MGAVGVSFALASTALAEPPGGSRGRAQASGPITSNRVVRDTHGVLLWGVDVVCAASTACELVAYDSASATANTSRILWEVRGATNTTTGRPFAVPIVTSRGLYVEVDGGGHGFVSVE